MALIYTTIFTSCKKESKEILPVAEGTITIGVEKIALKTGRSIYYGANAAYNTDLFISTLSQEDIEALSSIELSEGVFSASEEYKAAYNKILGDRIVGTFYVEAFSDIIKKIASEEKKGFGNSNTFVNTNAQFSYGDDLYSLDGKLKVLQSSKNHYELEFYGVTTDGTEVDLSFDGDFIYENNILGVKTLLK